jgi:hypothetical protein
MPADDLICLDGQRLGSFLAHNIEELGVCRALRSQGGEDADGVIRKDDDGKVRQLCERLVAADINIREAVLQENTVRLWMQPSLQPRQSSNIRQMTPELPFKNDLIPDPNG